jgi:class 3 adenylate cyclase/tetratricopeptide (TPR) repeat protein
MACLSCGAETRPNQKFCSECGLSLARACPSCGTAYEGSPKFCAECGTPFAASAPPASASAALQPVHSAAALPIDAAAGTTAERKLVSVLFADLVGFTTLAENRDAEAVREQLTEYFAIAQEIIGRYGGTVEKFIGDAVMAVWGTPVSHEDDAERAVRAALDLVTAVGRMGSDGQAIQARAGVLTGEAAVTLGATNQGMVAGDLVNTASRLQSVAPPGSVLVGEETFRSASRAIVFEPVGDQDLKGRTMPVPAHRALRVVAQRGGAGRADQLEAPFLGRDAELQLVKDLFHATSREKRPRLVSIIGQAGIGKSRLTTEFLNYIDGIKQRVLWHQGRSPAYGEGITFWALGEMVRSRVGLLELDEAQATRTKLAEFLDTIVPDEAERRWMAPKLEQLLGVSETDGVEREELFAAWRTFFERVAGDDPSLLVFEDLHWADAGLLDFIEHLLEWSRGAGIYILTLSRPELLERRPNWGAGQRSFTSVALEPLPEEIIRQILSSLVPGLPEPVAEQIIARSEGIPLYAVETVRMLLQDGRLEAVNGAFNPVGDLSTLAVPATLHALIAARLDALDAADRTLLQEASVLGQTFTRGGLAALSGEDGDLEERLLGLVKRELLTLDSDPRSPERGQYGFVQALVRDVAYNTLSKRDRKVLHLAAGEHFVSLNDEEIVDATAMHFLDAYRSAPEDPDASATRERAAELLQRAAERATLLGSHEQAVRYLELALDVTAETIDQVQMLARAGQAAGSAGKYEMSEVFLRRALDAARAGGDLGAEARTIATLGRVLATAVRPADAIAEIEPALDRFTELHDDPAMVAVWAALARAFMLHNDYLPAVEWADRALPLAERLDMVPETADLLNTRATALSYGGRVREGIAGLRGVLALADSHDLGYAALRARINISGALIAENPRDAWQIGVTGLLDAKRTGQRDMLVAMCINLAMAAIRIGEWESAASTLSDASAMELDPIDRFGIQAIQVILAAVRDEPFAALLQEATDFAVASTEPTVESQLESARGWVALVEGRFADAHAASHRSVELVVAATGEDMPAAGRAALWAGDAKLARMVADELRASGIHGRAIHTSLLAIEGGIAALDDRIEDAADAYRDAMRRWRDLEAWFELALCQLDFVRFVGGERPDVIVAADEARATFARLGTPTFVRRLDEALGLPKGSARP